MDFIVYLIIYGVSIFIAFFLGAWIKTQKEVKIQNPVNVIKEIAEDTKTSKEIKKEQERYKIIAENIDNYNGTSKGQKEIPR